jgi:hypothetical protein
MQKSYLLGAVCAGIVTLFSPATPAKLMSDSYHGKFTTWTDNPFGFAEDDAITLHARYDEAWITQRVDPWTSELIGVVNFIDHYDQGARLNLSIGGNAHRERSTENPIPTSETEWYNSLPYLLFDDEDTPIGLGSQWLVLGIDWEYQIYANSEVVSITGEEYSSSERYYLEAVINFIPNPPTLWLIGPGLLGLVGIRRRLRTA